MFDETGIFLIFITTILVFAWVIFTFIIWIDNIAKLGQVKTLLKKTENEALKAVKQYAQNPYLGCNHLEYDEIPEKATAIYADEYGFLNDINLKGLNQYCENLNAKVYITKYKGEHLACSEILAYAKCIPSIEQGV